MHKKRVGGRLWGDDCKEWWDNFGKICVYACLTGWLFGRDVEWLRDCSIPMGKAHLVLLCNRVPQSHFWIANMHFFARKWRILSKFSCFAMEGSRRRLKCMLRNNGGLSLLCCHLGVQVVVDKHTIDDSLRRSYGYSNQMGYQTSDFRLLWTITPNPPPPHPNTLSTPPPCQTSPPPPMPPQYQTCPLSPHP